MISNQRAWVWALAAVALATWGRAADYDPLAPGPAPTHQDLVVRDEGRQRDIPLRVYLPAAAGKAPVVLFSHGLGGSRANGPYLLTRVGMSGYSFGSVTTQAVSGESFPLVGRRFTDGRIRAALAIVAERAPAG